MAPARVALARVAMRTRFEVVVCGHRSARDLRAAAEAALAEIDRAEAEISVFLPTSSLSQINAHADRRPMPVDGLLFALLARTEDLVRATGGAFDPTIGVVLPALRARAPGARRHLARVQRNVGWDRMVKLDADALTIAFRRPGARIELGAIGKGWALDRAASVLRDVGIEAALLHGGTSSVVALGSPPGAPGWKIAIADPNNKARPLATVTLRDQSLGVSAIHGRTHLGRGKPEGHVVDPRTGKAVAHTLLAAVVCDSATDADAASTALVVLGDRGRATVIRALPPGASALVLTNTVGRGELHTRGPAFRTAAASVSSSHASSRAGEAKVDH